jgi:hypothetical protein
MDHEPFHLLLALRLYDELDPHEKADLDHHLAACAPCQRRGRELELGLGAQLPSLPSMADVLPEGFSDSSPATARPGGLRRWMTVAASFAAGLTLALTWPDAPEPGPTSVAEPPGFERPAPPPVAPTRGRLAALPSLR